MPNSDSSLALYEFPFNEGIRTMLRLEQLFERLHTLIGREQALDHHFALLTLFEILDVASRADLKSDLLKELDRHRARLAGFRGHPHIAEATLEAVLTRIEQAFDELHAVSGKAGQALATNEWLMGVRSRINIPGGTCAFDLPAYFAWQHASATHRQAELRGWASTLAPLDHALNVLLGLVRESAGGQRVLAPAGVFQQRLPEGKSYQLLRLELPPSEARVPEISGHRLMISVRMMKADGEGRLRPDAQDACFDLALCS